MIAVQVITVYQQNQHIKLSALSASQMQPQIYYFKFLP